MARLTCARHTKTMQRDAAMLGHCREILAALDVRRAPGRDRIATARECVAKHALKVADVIGSDWIVGVLEGLRVGRAVCEQIIDMECPSALALGEVETTSNGGIVNSRIGG